MSRWVLLLLSLASGCSLTVDFGDECSRDDECAARQRVCRQSYCVVEERPDGSVGQDTDAALAVDAAPDSGPPDIGVADGGTPDSGAPDSGPAPGSTIVHSATVTASTRWSADFIHELAQPIYVSPGVRLVIEAGAVVRGRPGSALIVRAGAELEAVGTAQRPIVFTSARPVGQRSAGDWGGVALLGNAPVNVGQGRLEGVPPVDQRTRYGGADPSHPCGVLRYVRIEFAGYRLYTNNELNALTLAGCGDGTIVEYVQTHRGLDDGVEVFGGTVGLSHVVVSQPGDDGFDWAQGWRGVVQFLIVQMGRADGDSAIEADNEELMFDAQPRSSPQLYNVTLVGGGRSSMVGQRGMVLRRGTAGALTNTLILGFSTEAIDIRDVATRDCLRGEASCGSDRLQLRGLWLFDVGPDGTTYFSSEADDDGALDERSELVRTDNLVRIGVDPQLLSPYDPLRPGFQPTAGSPIATSSISVMPPQAEMIDETARFVGALRPGVAAWTDGWTAFPEN